MCLSRRDRYDLLGHLEGKRPLSSRRLDQITSRLSHTLARRPKKASRVEREAGEALRDAEWDIIKRKVFARARANPFHVGRPRCERIFASGRQCRHEAVDPHHVFGRKHVAATERNVVSLCRECHEEIGLNRPSAVLAWQSMVDTLRALGFHIEAVEAEGERDYCAAKIGLDSARRAMTVSATVARSGGGRDA